MKFKNIINESKTFSIKAFVYDRDEKKDKFVTFEEEGNNIKDAIKVAKQTLVSNGYRLHQNHIHEEKFFDYIMDVASYTNSKELYNDVWKYLDKEFKSPEDAIEYVKKKSGLY